MRILYIYDCHIHTWPLTENMATRLAEFMPSRRNLSPIPGRGGSSKEKGNFGFGLRRERTEEVAESIVHFRWVMAFCAHEEMIL